MNARTSQRTLAALISAGLGLSSAGCSFLFHTGLDTKPSSVNASTDLDCTRHPVFPILDTLNAAGNVVNIAMAADESGIYRNNPVGKEATIGLNVAFMVLYGASAVWGFHEVSQCSEAHERKEQLLEGRDSMPPPSEPAAAERPPRRARQDVVGFVLGSSVEEAAEACRKAGHRWSDAEGEVRCDGVPSGEVEGATARLEFAEGRLSAVELVIEPPADAPAWAGAFREAEAALVRRYGKPQQRSFAVPAECKAAEAFLGCVADGRVAGSASWSTGGHSVALSIAGAPAPSTIRVRFAK